MNGLLYYLEVPNEPTDDALTDDARSEETDRVLVYDLGGGTFDVSVAEITGAVTEVHVPDDAATQARLLRAAEQVKIDLSSHPAPRNRNCPQRS
jgi:molecular chaperone DnaK